LEKLAAGQVAARRETVGRAVKEKRQTRTGVRWEGAERIGTKQSANGREAGQILMMRQAVA